MQSLLITSAIEQDLRTVLNYLGPSDPVEPVKIGFLFGHWSKEHRIEHAAKIYHQGLIQHIAILSGHGGQQCPWPEGAGVHQHDKLMDLGVPHEAILFSECATNTLEEAQQAFPTVLHLYGTDCLKERTWILISDQAHQRRASRAFNRWNPSIKGLNWPCPLPLNEETIREAVLEMNKLRVYGDAGDIAPGPEPTSDVLAAFQRLAELV